MDELDLLETDPPDQNVERIRFFAKALAYGVVQNRWLPEFNVMISTSGAIWVSKGRGFTDSVGAYIKSRWNGQPPHPSLLTVFQYLDQIDEQGYRLTLKAFELLEEPASPPSVFISYSHDKSSAFGLLIAARLQAKGIRNPFIDMNLEPGDKWHAELEEKVRQSSYFVCLIAPETLHSEYVIKEIRWALSALTVTAIPIWHSGFNGKADCEADILDFVKQTNAIVVTDESAKGYNTAVVELLNRMGYAP